MSDRPLHVEELEAEVRELRERVKELEAALQPFARAWNAYKPFYIDAAMGTQRSDWLNAALASPQQEQDK